MKLYHFPSPNPQKVTFALKELGLDCEASSRSIWRRGSSGNPPFWRSIQPGGRRSSSMAI